jgi:hypothetical protein
MGFLRYLINQVRNPRGLFGKKIAEKWTKLGNFEIHLPEEYKDFLTRAGITDIQIFKQKE